jgi:flagellar biogenesis protein FliO
MTTWAVLGQALGTKPDLVLTGSDGGGQPWIPVIVVLAALGLAARWLVRRGLAAGSDRPGARLAVCETATLGPGHVAIVEAAGTTLLVGVTAQGFVKLADLPSRPVEPAFLDVLDQAESATQATAASERWEKLRLT